MYDMAENNAKTKQVIARKFIPRKLQKYPKKTSLPNVYSLVD